MNGVLCLWITRPNTVKIVTPKLIDRLNATSVRILSLSVKRQADSKIIHIPSHRHVHF